MVNEKEVERKLRKMNIPRKRRNDVKSAVNSSRVMPKDVFSCNQCDYTAASSSILKRHKETIHLGIRYPCDLCDYKATQLGCLNKHTESIHQGIRYPCDLCDYKATEKNKLKRHKYNKH